MKSAIAIIVFGLLWCNVGFAEVINYECKSLSNNQGNFIYLKYILNTDNNKLDMKWKLKDTSQVGSETFDIIKIDSESIEYKNYSRPDEIYKFNYRGNLIDTIITGEYKGVKISKCSETKLK